jgi:hypothetical protein
LRGTREQILEWEARWSLRAGLAALAGVALLIVSAVVISSAGATGDADLLRSFNEHSSDVTLSAVLEAIGFLFLIPPLYFLFRAAAARNPQMRMQLVGLVIAAPLFFSISAVLNGTARNEAADQFVAGEAKSTLTAKEATTDCESELNDLGKKEFAEEFDAAGKTPQADCVETKVADDEATNALTESSTHSAAIGFGLGGRIGLAIALFYTCLNAMRVGLLSRFWGSLGMALGVAALLLLVQFTLIFFLYLGILLIGKLPSGKSPAWETGEAAPWPTPGEKAAAEMAPSEPEAIDVDSTEISDDGAEKRKRKQRD